MENMEITAGNDPVKSINVLDAISNNIAPESFISHAQPGFMAIVDDKETMRNKIGKNFESEEDFNAFHDYASNLANAYNANVDNKRKPSKIDFHYGARTLDTGVISGAPTFNLPGSMGYKYAVSPRRIAREKGTYRYFDEDLQQDVEAPIDPMELVNPFNNFVIDGMKEGNPYMRKIKGSEYDPSYQRYSIWGNDSAYGMKIYEPLVNFAQEALLSIPTVIAFAGKLGSELDKATGTVVAEYEGDIWNETLNAIERMKWQPSDYIMEGGWFNHGMLSKSQMYNLGGGLGLLMPQRWAAKWLAKGATAGMKKQAKNLLPHVVPGRILRGTTDEALEATTKVVGENVTNPKIVSRMTGATGQSASKLAETFTDYNYRIQKAMKRNAMIGSMSVGTMQAVKGFYDEAKIHGVSDEYALWMTLAAMPAVGATEFFLGKYLTKGIGDDMITPSSIWGDGAAVKHLKGVIAKEFGMAAKAGTLPASAEAKGFFVNTIMKKAIPGLKNIVSKGLNVPVLGGATYEGLQEGSEQAYYIGLQQLYDTYWASADGGEFNKSKDQIWKELKENFWAGFILGGVMDAATGTYRNKQQDKFVESMIINGQDNELAAIVKRAYRKGYFGLTGLNYNGEQQLENAPGSGLKVNQNGELDAYGFDRNYEIKTQNDMNAYNFIQKINITKDAYNYGVHNVDNITAYGEDPSIVGEVLQLSKVMLGIEGEVKDLTEKLNVAKRENIASVPAIEAEIKSKQDELAKLQLKYKEATVPTIYDENTKRSYTKRANEKIAEIIYSEIEKRPVKIAEINENMDMLKKYQEWKTNELVRLKAVAQKRDELVKRAESLKFSGAIEDVDSLIQELTEQLSMSNVDEFRFQPAMMSTQAKTAYENVLAGIDALMNNPERMQQIISDPAFSMFSGFPQDKALEMIQTELKEKSSLAKSGGTVVKNQMALMDIAGNLNELINPSKVANNPELKLDWDENLEAQKTLEYLLTGDNGTQLRDDLRAEIITLGMDIENATDYELQKVKELIGKVEQSRKLIKFAEVANNTNITAGRRVIPLVPTRVDEQNNVNMGNEISPETLLTGTLLLDQYMDGIPDFTINDKGEISFNTQAKEIQAEIDEINKARNAELSEGKKPADEINKQYDDEIAALPKITDEMHKAKIFPGLVELQTIFEGAVAKRSVRENKRHRGRVYRNVQMAKFIISAVQHKNIFATAESKMVALIDAVQDIFDDKKVSNERVIELQGMVADLMTAMYKDINSKGVKEAQENLKLIVDKILEQTNKFFDLTTSSEVKFSYKGYTPARDNVKIEYDDFLSLQFSDFERIVEMIRVSTGQKSSLPEGYDYSDQAIRNSILSMWVLETTNFANMVATLDTDQFLKNYDVVKDKMEFMPSSQQEYAIMQAFALMTARPGMEFEARRSSLRLYTGETAPEGKNWEMRNFPIAGMFIQAINGAGKTTVMARSLALLLNQEISRINPNASKTVVLVSPSGKLSDKLKQQFEGLANLKVTAVLSNEFENNMEAYKDADYVIYDEATRFPVSRGQHFLNVFGENHIGTNKKTKFIFLGDPTQSRNGDINASSVTDTFIGMIMPRTITVSEVFRTEIFDIARLTQLLQKNIMGLKSSLEDVVFPASKYSTDFSEGVYYANSPEEVIAKWLQHIQMPGIKRSLIVRSSLERKNLIDKLGSQLTEDQKKLIRFINSSPELTPAENDAAGGTIQGDETDGAYVAFAPTGNDPSELIDFKTAIGRATKFVMIAWEKGFSSPSNQITKTNLDTEAVKAETAEKKARIETLAKRVPTTSQPVTVAQPAAQPAPIPATNTNQPVIVPGPSAAVNPAANASTATVNLPGAANNSTTAAPQKVTITEVRNAGVKYSVSNAVPLLFDSATYTVKEAYQYNGDLYYVMEVDSPFSVDEVLMSSSEYNNLFDNSIHVKDNSDETTLDNSPLKNALRTALKFHNSGKSQVRFSLGSTTNIVPFTKAHFDAINKVLNNQGAYKIEMRFENQIELYDKEGNRNTNYNVITIIAIDNTGAETLLGTMYQPYLNETDLADNFGKKSLSNNKYESVEASYSSNESPVNNEALNSFNTFLQDLYHKGQNSQTRLIASNIVLSVNGGMAQVEYTKPRTVRTLVLDVLGKGGTILVKDGGNYVYKSSLTSDEWANIVVEQKVNSKGYTTPFIYLSYTPNPSTANYQDALENSVPIEINGLKYSESASAMTEFNDGVKSLLDSISALRAKDSDSMRVAIESLFNKSNLSKATTFNRWIFRDRSISNKNEAYVLDPSYSGLLSVRKNFLNPVFDTSGTVDEVKKNAADTIRKIAEKIALEGFTYRGINNISKSDQQFIPLATTDFAEYKTPVQDLYAPEATIVSMTMNPNYGNNNTPPASNRFQAKEDTEFLTTQSVAQVEYEDIANHRENLINIFGEEFVNNSLEFTPNKNMFGVDAFGAVHNFKMLIYRKGNQALKGVEYHEAVHYAMRYFISPESRNMILADMKEAMNANGIGGEISNKQAEEYLSEMARTGVKTKGKKKISLWQKFVKWFNNLIGNVRQSDWLHEQFLEDLKTGKYRNAKAKYNNGEQVVHMSMDTTDEDSYELSEDEDIEYEDLTESEDSEEDISQSKLTKYSQLVRQFGGQANYKNAIKLVRAAIMSASAYNPVVNARTSRSLVESIENAYERISNSPYINRYGLTPLASKEVFDELMKFVLPEFMVSDRMIEEVFSSNYDTKDIDIKKNLSKGLELIIRSLPKHTFSFVRANHAGPKFRHGKKTIGIHHAQGDLITKPTINWEYLHAAMIQAAESIGTTSKAGGTQTSTITETPLQQWLNKLREMAIDYMAAADNVEAANNILSFLMYADFMNDGSDVFTVSETVSDPNSSDAKLPLTKLVNNLPEIIQAVTDNNNIISDQDLLHYLTQDPGGVALREKQRAASIVLNALSSYALSLINNDMSLTEVELNYDAANNFRPMVRRSSVVQVNKTRYNHQLDYRLYDNNMIKESVWLKTSGVTNDRAAYKITKDGVSVNRGEGNFIQILRFDGTRFHFIEPSSEFADAAIIYFIRQMMRDIGLGSVSHDTISRIYKSTSETFAEYGGQYTIDYGTRISNTKALSKHGLANMLGGIMTAIRIDSSLLNSREKLTDEERDHLKQIEELTPIVERIVKNARTTFETDDVLKNLNDIKNKVKNAKQIEKEIRNGSIVSITGSFDLHLEGLAVMEAASNGQIMRRWSYGANGQKIYNQNLKTNLDLLYGKLFSHGNTALSELQQSGINVALQMLPMFRLRNAGAGSVFTVSSLTKSSGLRSDYEGKSISEFTVNDLINHDIFGHFFSSLYNTRTQKRQILSVPIPNPGDSNQKFIVNIQIDGRPDGIRLIEYDNGSRSFKMNPKGEFFLNTLFDMQMDYNFEMAKNAITAFSNVAAIRLDNRMDLQLFSPMEYNGSESDIDTHIKNIEQVNAILRSYNIAELQESFDKAGLINGTHYSVENGILQLGRLPLMTEQRNHIYTLSNYIAWKSLKKQVGMDLSQNNPIYTSSGLLTSQMVKQQIPLNKLRDQMFFKDFTDLARLVQKGISDGVKIPEFVEKSNLEYKEGKKGMFAIRDELFMGNKVVEYNPFYSTFMYMYHFVSSDISAHIMGDTSQKHDITKYGKYDKGIVTQGFTPQVRENPIYGMSKVKKVVAIQDESSITKYAELFGIVRNNVHTDGLVISSGIAQKFYSHDLGDEMGMSRPGDKTVKSLYQAVDRRTGFGTQIKSSKIVMNEDMMDHAPVETMAQIRFMYNRPVEIRPGWVYNPFERWNQFYEQTGSLKQADQMLYDDIVNHRIATGVDVAANMISEIVMSSTVKIDAPYVNNTKTISNIYEDGQIDNFEPYAIMELDPKMDRLMLNANQSKNKTKVAAPIQIEEIIGTVQMDAMNGLLALNRLQRERTAWREDTRKYLQNLLYNTISARQDASMNIEIAINPEVSPNIPFIFGTLVPNISSQLKKGIHKKTTGRKLVQEPSQKFIKYVDAYQRVYSRTTDEAGNEVITFTRGVKVPGVSMKEILEDNARPEAQKRYDYDPEALNNTSQLQHTQYLDENGNDVADLIKQEHPELVQMIQQRKALKSQIMDLVHVMNTTKKTEEYKAAEAKKIELLAALNVLQSEIESIRQPYLQSIKRVIPAQVAMEWNNHAKFGLDPNVRYSLNDLFTLTFKDGSSINIREYLKANSYNYYKTANDAITMLKAELAGRMDDIAEDTPALIGITKLFKTPNVNSLASWYNALSQSTMVFGVRIPSSLWGSAFAGEITTITHDSPSMIYTSHEKNVLDDSDYDIDQLTVLSRNIKIDKANKTINGFKYNSQQEALSNMDEFIEKNATADIENLKFQMYIDFFLDTQNIDKMMSTFELDLIKEHADRISPSKMAGLTGQYNAAVGNHQNSHDGKNLVAYAANAIHNVATLMHMPASHRSLFIPGINLPMNGKIRVQDEFGTSERYLITELALFLQIAVDNVKHMTAGRLNFNPATVNTAIGLLIKGNTAHQVFNILTDAEVMRETNKILASRSIDQFNINLYETFNNIVADLMNRNTEEYLIDRYNERVAWLKNRITELSEDLATISEDDVTEYFPVIGDVVVGPASNISESEDGMSEAEIKSLLKELQSELTELETTPIQDYLDYKTAQSQGSIEKMVKVRDAALVGEAMGRISSVLKYYNTLPSSHADLYSEVKRLEWITRSPIGEIPITHDPSRITQMVTANRNEDHYQRMLQNQIRFLQGANTIGRTVPFVGETQDTVNNRVTALFDKAMEILAGMEYKGIPILELVNLRSVNGGQTGMDMAGNFATLKHGIPTDVIMPQGFKYRLPSGVDVKTKTRAEIRQMYSRADNLDMLGIFEAGADVEIEGSPKSYSNRTKHVIGKADHVLSVTVNNSPGMMLTNKLARASKPITELNAFDFETDETIDKAAEKYANDLYKVMLSYVKMGEDNNSGMKPTITINIAGNELSTMLTRPLSEAEAFLEMEQKLDAIVNPLGIIRANRAMNAYFTVLKAMNQMVSETFYQYSPIVQELAEQISIMAGGNGILSKANYIKVVAAMDSVMAKAYLEREYGNKPINTFIYGDYKEKVSIASSLINSLEALPGGRLNVGNIDQLNAFINLMPAIVDHYKNTIVPGTFNSFLRSLNYDAYGNLFIPDVHNMNEMDIQELRNDFNNLDEPLKEMFHIYNLAMVGFKNKMNSLSPFIGIDFYVNYSRALDVFKTELDNPDSELTKEIKRTFAENTIGKEPEIARRLSDKRFQNLDNRPEFARTRPVFERFGIPTKAEWFELVRLNPNWRNLDVKGTGIIYRKVNNRNSLRMKGVQEFHRGQLTELDAVHLTSEEQVSDWLNKGTVTVHTRKVHNYSMTNDTDFRSYVTVDGTYGKIVGMTDTSITIVASPFEEWARAKRMLENELAKDTDPLTAGDIVMDSRMIHDGKPLTKKAFRRLMKALKKANPSLDIREVNNATTHRPMARGYVYNGIVHYNSDLVTHDTPIHEIMHPILIGMLNSKDTAINKMGVQLMTMAKDQIAQQSELYRAIKSAYPDLSGVDLQMEIAVTIAGLVSEQKVMRFAEESRSLWEKIGDFVTGLWNDFSNIVSNIFNSGNTASDLDADYQTRRPEFTIDSTYQDLVNHVIDMIFSGEVNMIMDEVQELDLVNRMESRPLNIVPGANTPKNVNPNATRTLIKQLVDIKDLEDELLLGGDLTDVDTKRKENIVNSIYRELLTSKDKKFMVNSETFEMSQFMDPGMEVQAKQIIREKIIPEIIKSKNAASEALANLMNSGNIFNSEEFEKAFTVKIDGRTVKMYSKETIGKALSLMEFSQGQTIVQLSKLQGMSSIYPGLAEALPKGFKGADPYVIIHNKKTSDKGTVYDVSLFDISTQTLNFFGKGLNAESLITDNFLDSPKARGLGVVHRADLRAARQIILAIQMMGLKKNLPTVNIRKAGVIELIPYRGSRKNAGYLSYTPVNMNMLAPEIGVIANSIRFDAVATDEMKAVLNTPELYKAETYNPDYLEMLMAAWGNKVEELENTFGEESRGVTAMKHRLQTLQDYINGKGTVSDILRVIRLQKDFLEGRYSLISDSEKYSNIEYRMLVMAENSLTAFSEKGIKSNMNSIQKFGATTYNQPNELVQNYINVQRNAFSLIVDRYKEEIKDLDALTKPRIAGLGADTVKRLLTDTSDNYFKKLYMTEEIDGQIVNLGRLHWDPKDPRTILAMREGLTTQDLEYSNKILDIVEKQMKALIRQRYVNENKFTMQLPNGEPDMEAINKAVEIEYDRNWDRGLMPVMTKTPAQMIMSGKGHLISRGIAKYFQKVVNYQNIFSEMIDLNNTGESVDKIKSLFENQIIASDNNIYGGHARLRGLGLEYIDGKLRVVDKKQNDALSLNAYSTVKYLVMDAIQKEVMEQDILPAYNNARLLGKVLETVKGEDYDVALDYLLETYAQNVAGRNTVAAKEEKNLEGLAAFTRMLIRMTTFNGVALSVPVAITSMAANTYESLSNALANTAGNPYNMFTIKDEMQAIIEISTNFKKVKAFENKYQVIESERRDMLSQQKYDMTRMNMLDENFWHIMNRATDLTARRVAMVAQALHDGSYQAHDDEGNYDVKKDRRYFNANGTQTEEQAALLKGLVKDLINDKFPGQKNSQLPLKAYSYTEQRKLEMVGTQFGVGVFGAEAGAVGSNHLWFEALMQFKKFASAAIGSRISPYMETIEGGSRQIKRDANGEAVRDAFGEIVTEFVKMQTEGTWRTAIRVGGEVLASAPIIGDIMTKAGLVLKPRSLSELANMTSLERRNLVKAALDVIIFVAAYFMYVGMMKDVPDDAKRDYKRYGRLIAAVKNGLDSAVIASPMKMIDMATSIAVLSNAKRMLNLFTLGSDAGKEITYLVPLGGTVRAGVQIYNETE